MSEKTSELPRLVALSFAMISSICCHCCGQTVSRIDSQENTIDVREAASMVEACFLNLASLEKGDFLIRVNKFGDSVAEAKAGDPSLLDDTVAYHRVVFDHPNDRLFYSYVSESKKFVFNDPVSKKDVIESSHKNIKGFIYSDEHKVGYKMPFRPTKLRKNSQSSVIAEEYDMPDVRLFGICNFGSGNKDSVRNKLTHLTSDRISLIKPMPDEIIQIRFTLADSSLFENGGGMETDYYLDTRRLVPIKIVAAFIVNGVRAQDWSVETFEWDQIADRVVPKKVRREVKSITRINRERHHCTYVQTAEFHCFSVDKDLDESIFNPENIGKLDRLVKLCDPQATKATTLLPMEKSSN